MKKSKLFLTILLCLTTLSLISCTSPVASSVTSGTDTGTSVTSGTGTSGTGTSGTDTTTTPATPSVTLSSIAVSGTLANALYYVGDRVNTSGLTVTATYSDGSTKTVTSFTASAFSEVNLGTEQTITISYTEGSVTKTATVNGTFYIAAAGAKPTESPVLLSDYTGTLTGGTYYKFGDFPQTISALTGDGAYTTEPVYRGWYLGSDGYFYAKCTENAYSSSYTYSNGTTIAQSSANSQKYFKVEPIVWRAVTRDYNSTGKALLLAEKELTANVPYYGSNSNRTLSGATIYPNNYKYSNIRAYLNGKPNQFVTDGGTATTSDIDWTSKGFIDTAFTSSAQDLIATTSVDNSAESTTDAGNNLTQATTYACANTEDKIFLLSEKEATTEAYGFTTYDVDGIGNSRIRVPTDYAKANYAYLSGTDGYGGHWWLRSPKAYYNSGYVISYSGSADGSGSVVDWESRKIGVVPALSISIGN